MDKNYTGWCFKSILEASSRVLSICNVIKNTEQNYTVKLSRDKTTFTTVVEGVTPTANNHLATKQYVDSHSSSVTVDSTLSMTNNQISMPNKLSSALSQNLYKCSFDKQGRCTGATAVTMPNPHLYIHKWHFDRGGTGEVNFIILTTQSTRMYESGIGQYLASLNCGPDYWTAYPASGQASNGTIVSGIYAVPRSSSTFFTLDVYVVSYASGGNSFTARLTSEYCPIESASCTILQLF